MQVTTHLRKMSSRLDGQNVQYFLPLVNITERKGELALNPLIGENIKLRFTGQIHCIATGKKIKKTFGEGLSYEAFMTSPLASPSIVRPELSRIHEGIALRDFDWENEHHNQPHYVYLSRTSEVKVGVTRTTNIPYRWIDQGASEAIIIAETPYRQLAGLIEVHLKDHFADKTNWQAMLKNVVNDQRSLLDLKEEALQLMGSDYESFIYENDDVTHLHYPIEHYPLKVKSIKLDTLPDYEGRLRGIKGQYLYFDDGLVLNVRSHAGYEIQLEAE